MKPDRAWVYIMTNRPRGVLYTGVTTNLPQRVSQHKLGTFDGFTNKYKLHRLAWCEEFARIDDAIAHEKHLKRWRRAWKIDLVEKNNPNWDDIPIA
ncbi:MAG: GIY-YIG nuclease family protein [Alphaproteobacteria bacterium]